VKREASFRYPHLTSTEQQIEGKLKEFEFMKASETVVTPFARLALGFSFLSAVADRFGLWGALGAPHVAWGDFAHFITYTATLNWFLPRCGPAIHE
jgi:hypothetical protein